MACSINTRLCSDTIFDLEKKIIDQTVSPQTGEQLALELDAVKGALDLIEEMELQAAYVNSFAIPFINELRQRVVSLYGQLDNSISKYHVSILDKETALLEDDVRESKMQELADLIETMTDQLSEFWSCYSPLFSERRILARAYCMIQMAQEVLNGKEGLDLSWDTENVYLETEEALEEIANFLSQNERKAARFAFNRLTAAQKKLCQGYLRPHDVISSFLHDIEASADNHLALRG